MNLTAAHKRTRRVADLGALDTLKAFEAARPTAASAYEFVGFEDGLATYRTGTPTVAYDIPKPPATRATKAYRAAIIALLIVVAGLASALGILLTHHDAAAGASDSTIVSSYNAGFSDSKFDDCQQGDTTACAWLHTN